MRVRIVSEGVPSEAQQTPTVISSILSSVEVGSTSVKLALFSNVLTSRYR